MGGKGSSAFIQPAAHIFHSICTSQASVSCSGWLEAGFYVVIPFSFIAWQDGHEAPPSTHRKATEGLHRSKDYFLSVFSSRPLILDKVHLRPGFVAQAIHLLAKKVGKRIEVSIARGFSTSVCTCVHVWIPCYVDVCMCVAVYMHVSVCGCWMMDCHPTPPPPADQVPHHLPHDLPTNVSDDSCRKQNQCTLHCNN